jgi:acetyltransferase-like isoleucine patch superfamily enzyme
MFLKSFWKYTKKIRAHNFFAILYFNFKMLPLRQAIKLPFDFYYSVRFHNLSGKVILNCNEIYRGMFKFGGRGSEMFSRTTTIIDLKGTLELKGPLEIGHGCLLRIENAATVSFGANVRLGALTKMFAEHQIIFGDEIDFSWESQIFDTNFHYIKDVNDNTIDSRVGSVKIGSRNWFGNRVTVMKDTVTPDDLIVASNSLCNKDYSSLPIYSVIGGIPAKLIASNKQRLFENLVDVSQLNEK